MNDMLTLQPDVVNRLASGHDATATSLRAATAAPAGIGATVAETHGPFTSTFNNALSAYEAVCVSAGRALEGVADGLSTNLTRAFAAYADTDQRGAEILDEQIDN
ncbi:ESX-1 secretion-associated protein [Mycobacterium ulcerans]|uniref:ESX-1 secretion-associated protein n=1 Tax=Mycobacterium ulcerans TaxID=1809 RepID=UPI00106D5B9A|nr:ESX-1 secretion-associated protein [Mycobacterium ulcerans]